MSKYKHNILINGGIGYSGDGAVGNSGTGEEARISFSDIWDAIRRGKWIIAGTTLVVGALVSIYSFMLPAVYEASAVVHVSGASTTDSKSGEETTFRVDLSNDVGVLQQSTELAAEVAEGLLEMAGKQVPYEQLPLVLDEEGKLLDKKSATWRVFEKTSFSPSPSQGLLRITAESNSPREAAIIANLYSEAYQRYTIRSSRERIVAKKKFLENQVQKFWGELSQIQSNWAAYAQGKQIYTQGTSGERLVAEVSAFRQRRSEANLKREQAEATRRLLERRLVEVEAGLPTVAEEFQASRELSELQGQIDALDSRIAALELKAEEYYIVKPDLRGKEGSVPQLSEILRQITHFQDRRRELERRYIAEVTKGRNKGATEEGSAEASDLRRRLATTTLEIQETANEIEILDAKIRTYDANLASLPRQAIDLERMEREKSRVEQLYNTFQAALTDIQISEEAELGYAKIMRTAEIPMLPVRPNRMQNIVVGIALGLGLGFGLAFLRHAGNSRVRSPQELEERGYNVVGIIPPFDRTMRRIGFGRRKKFVGEHEVSTGLMPLHDPWSAVAENYRLLRTKVQYTTADTGTRVLLVTSSETGEGKTLTAVNLGVVVAQSNQKVLLIDADMRRPSAHRLLGMSNEPGLAEVLEGKFNSSDSIRETPAPNLSFLPAGKAETPAAELLGSATFASFISQVRTQYDLVILDSPPVLAVSDPLLIALQSDATLVVTTADKTDIRALDVTRKLLGSVGVRIGGTVLNRYNTARARDYTYGYGYSSYVYASDGKATA